MDFAESLLHLCLLQPSAFNHEKIWVSLIKNLHTVHSPHTCYLAQDFKSESDSELHFIAVFYKTKKQRMSLDVIVHQQLRQIRL